jgi:hypothetical protein
VGRARPIRRRATNSRFRSDLGGPIAFAGMAATGATSPLAAEWSKD